MNFSYQVVPFFFVADYCRWIFVLRGSAAKSSKPGKPLVSSPSSPILNDSSKLAWCKKYRYLSKASCDHLTLRMWILLLHHNFAIHISTGYYRVGHSPLLFYYELLVVNKMLHISKRCSFHFEHVQCWSMHILLSWLCDTKNAYRQTGRWLSSFIYNSRRYKAWQLWWANGIKASKCLSLCMLLLLVRTKQLINLTVQWVTCLPTHDGN